MGKILALCISEKKGTLKTEINEAKFIEDFGIENMPMQVSGIDK